MVERASKRQQELLSFVDGFIQQNGYGPSYREIMSAIGYKSVSTVAIHIENLIAKGYLARKDKSARSLEVVTNRASATVAEHNGKDSDARFEVELGRRVKAANLSEEQRKSVADTLDLLRLTQLASTLRTEGENETQT